MIKKLIGFLFFTAVAIIIAAVFFSHIILASVLTGVLGAPVKIEKIALGSKTGIYGLTIGSPKGFKEERLVFIPEASLDLNVSALFKGKVHIRKIRLAMDEVTIEKGAGGKINLLELKPMRKPEKKQEAKPQTETPQTKPQPSDPAKPSKPAQPIAVQIDELLLNLNRARYVDSGVTPSSVKEYNLGVRNESFRDVTNLANLIKQLVFFVLKKVGLSSLTSNFDVLLKGVGGEVGEKLGKLFEKLNNI